MIKYIWKEHKNLIIIISVLLICSIAIALGIYAQVTNTKLKLNKQEVEEKNYTELKNNFKSIFTNSINRQSTATTNLSDEDILYIAYDFDEKESGKYDIKAKIPLFKLETKTTKSINKEIKNLFVKKIKDIVKNNTSNTIYSLDYVAYINDNILSLVLKITLKEGTSAQRIMIQTYNYDLENDKLLKIEDILAYKNLSQDDVQKKITTEIKKICDQTSNIGSQGYNLYTRDINDQMYLVPNTESFFLGTDKTLYIVYAYGNSNNTSTMDLVIF